MSLPTEIFIHMFWNGFHIDMVIVAVVVGDIRAVITDGVTIRYNNKIPSEGSSNIVNNVDSSNTISGSAYAS